MLTLIFNLFQLVPLHATLTVPQFTLSKESLDLVFVWWGKGTKLGSLCNKMLTLIFNLFQLVPLHATLTVPQFTLSKESLDFGVCLVG